MAKRRKRRKNPETSTLLIGGVVVAAVVVGVVLFEKHAHASPGLLVGTDKTQFQAAVVPGTVQGASGPLLAPGALQVTDKITVDVASAGLSLPEIPPGQNLLAQITAVDQPSPAFVMASSLDPRLAAGTIVQVPKAAITGVQPA